MTPLKLTFRSVLIAAVIIIAFAVAFDGLRKYNKVNAERSETSRQTQVEPARASVSGAETPTIASL